MTDALHYTTYGLCNKPSALVVLLHGMGSNADDMKEIASGFACKMPDTLFLLPEAPGVMELSNAEIEDIRQETPTFDPASFRSWFDVNIALLPLRLTFNRLSAIHQLNALIDNHLANYGLSDDELGMFGFSQGGTLAAYLGLKRNKPCAGVVDHSGPFIGFTQPVSRPKTLLLFGEQEIDMAYNAFKKKADQSWFPANIRHHIKYDFFLAHNSAKRLENRDVPHTYMLIPGLGHDMNEQSLRHASRFLKHQLASRPG